MIVPALATITLAVVAPLHVGVKMDGHNLRRTLDKSSFTMRADYCPVYDYRLGKKLEAQFLPCAADFISFANKPMEVSR